MTAGQAFRSLPAVLAPFPPDYPDPVGSIGCFLRTTRTRIALHPSGR